MWELLTWSMKNVTFWRFCQKHCILWWKRKITWFCCSFVSWSFILKICSSLSSCSILHKSVELRTLKKRPCQNNGAFVLTCLAYMVLKHFCHSFWLFKTKAPRLLLPEATWEPFGHQNPRTAQDEPPEAIWEPLGHQNHGAVNLNA